MYYFNSLLFKNLHSLFGMTQRNFSMKVYGIAHTYVQRINYEGTLTVNDLVDLCNVMHISVSKFITLDPNFAYRSNQMEYVINEKIFKPIKFGGGSIKKMYGKNGLAGKISQMEFAEKIGVSIPVIRMWANNERCTMKLSQLLDICNMFGVNIGEFIEDSNIPLPMNDIVVANVGNAASRVAEELLQLREIVSNDKKEISQLRQEIERMQLSIRGYQVAEEQYSYFRENAKTRKWIFNKDLLDNLPNLIGSSREEIFKNIGMSNPSTGYNDGNITIDIFIKVCNRYYISSKYFFIRENENNSIIHDGSYYQLADFSPIQFHPEWISDIFGKQSLTGMTKSEVANILKCTETKIDRWTLADRSTLRVNDLVEMCNVLAVTPSCFIIDTNRVNAAYNVTQNELFLEENRMLRQQILRLKEQNKKLKNKKR